MDHISSPRGDHLLFPGDHLRTESHDGRVTLSQNSLGHRRARALKAMVLPQRRVDLRMGPSTTNTYIYIYIYIYDSIDMCM